MYRGFVILGGSLILAACSSTPSWLDLDSLKPAPMTDTVQFESDPSGAEAKTTTGQTCRTPCSLSLPANAPFSVTFNLNGYQPETEQVELVSMGDGTTRLRPNPVMVDLTAAPPAPRKPAATTKKPAKKPTAKPAAKPRPTAGAAPASASNPASASPWPTPQQAR
jgi:hypothetical protein